jgi:hypothetical protein
VLRWIEALKPLLDRAGPLTLEEAAAWRRRLPALIAGGEALRYRCRVEAYHGATAEILCHALEEARSLQAELSVSAEPSELRAIARSESVRREALSADLLDGADLLVSRSAARREIEDLVGETEAAISLPATLALAIPPGHASALQGFNLCFFAFLCFQTLLWGTGLLHGADLSSVLLYAMILAPFWWWGGYLLQALLLALSPEQLSFTGRRVRLRRAWLGSKEFELADDGAEPIRRECWFEINLRPVHCLTLYAADGRRARFAVGRDPHEHERLLRDIREHFKTVSRPRPALTPPSDATLYS